VRSRSDREGALGYKLERLCRYITRPAIAEKRLSLTKQGKIRYELKTPYRDGATHVIFEPVDFTAPAHPCAHGIRTSMYIIACIEDPAVIRKILKHLQEQSPLDSRVPIPYSSRAAASWPVRLVQRKSPASPMLRPETASTGYRLV